MMRWEIPSLWIPFCSPCWSCCLGSHFMFIHSWWISPFHGVSTVLSSPSQTVEHRARVPASCDWALSMSEKGRSCFTKASSCDWKFLQLAVFDQIRPEGLLVAQSQTAKFEQANLAEHHVSVCFRQADQVSRLVQFMSSMHSFWEKHCGYLWIMLHMIIWLYNLIIFYVYI